MTVSTIPAQNSRFKIGWIILLVSTALMTFMHFSMIFILKEPLLFLGFAFFNLYALMVILIPFRRGEKWAWFATWLFPIGLALPGFLTQGSEIAFYYGVAAVCALGLFLTTQDFFPKR